MVINGERNEEKMKNLKEIDSILALLNILKTTTNISELEKWLRKYHNKVLDKTFLSGYKFFLNTVIRCLIGQIEADYSLGLKKDYTFLSAIFKSIPIKDIPNTCEKIIFIKNIWKSMRTLRKAGNWDDLKKSINKIRPLLKLFENIYRNSSLLIKMKKSDALKLITQYYTLIFLNDTSRNIPKGYISVSTIPSSETSKPFERYSKQYFEGYTLTLEFLWFKLLGKEKFEKTSIKDLHRAYDMYKEKVTEEIKFESSIFKEDKKLEEEMLKYKEWMALHYFFSEINEKIIKPQEEKIKKNLSFEQLFLIKTINKKFFQEFLGKADEPVYMRKKKREEIKKWLDYKLLWYDLEVLSSTGRIFSGVPAFLSVLIGLGNISKDKVLVKIFKHPEKDVKGFRYSYGILVPSFGTSGLTDYSGWLIFFDCASDFSGFGGSLYLYAKTFIELLEKEGRIDIEEIEVEMETFKEYIKEKAATSIFDVIKIKNPLGDVVPILDIYEIEKQKDEFINSIKGILFELLVLLWLYENKKEKFEKIYHNEDFEKGEIDIYCISKKENKVFLFECTIAIHEDHIERRINKIKDKKSNLKKRYQKYDIVPVLIVYCNVDSDRKEVFKKNGIEVKENFKEEIISWSNSVSKDWIKKVRRIIEWTK